MFFPALYSYISALSAASLNLVSLFSIASSHNYTFPKQQILDSSKSKEFEDDKIKVDETGREFSKWIENTPGKAEIAHYEQFLFFPECFQKTCTADT